MHRMLIRVNNQISAMFIVSYFFSLIVRAFLSDSPHGLSRHKKLIESPEIHRADSHFVPTISMGYRVFWIVSSCQCTLRTSNLRKLCIPRRRKDAGM